VAHAAVVDHNSALCPTRDHDPTPTKKFKSINAFQLIPFTPTSIPTSDHDVLPTVLPDCAWRPGLGAPLLRNRSRLLLFAAPEEMNMEDDEVKEREFDNNKLSPDDHSPRPERTPYDEPVFQPQRVLSQSKSR
jgi:hypothetical protein